MPEYANQTIMRQNIEHSFDSDNIDWLSIPLKRQETYASDTNIFEPTSHSLSSPHLPIETPKIKNTSGVHKILKSKGSNLIADGDDKEMTVIDSVLKGEQDILALLVDERQDRSNLIIDDDEKEIILFFPV